MPNDKEIPSPQSASTTNFALGRLFLELLDAGVDDLGRSNRKRFIQCFYHGFLCFIESPVLCGAFRVENREGHYSLKYKEGKLKGLSRRDSNPRLPVDQGALDR